MVADTMPLIQKKFIPPHVLADKKAKPNTILQWLVPDLLRWEMVKVPPESWVEPNANWAEKLFVNREDKVGAVLMAVAHERAVDYLKQAPILVVGAIGHKDMSKAAEREKLMRRWHRRLQSYCDLRGLMKEFHLAYPLRRLAAGALHRMEMQTFRALGQCDPSTLAQAIPTNPSAQGIWLYAISSWCAVMRRRFDDGTIHLEWALKNLTCDSPIENTAADLADFVGANRETFNPRWSFARVTEESQAWHLALQKAEQSDRFKADYGFEWDEAIDYAPLPHEVEIDGHLFRALRSGKALWEEGRDMHHCVSSYAREVLLGHSRIYSISRDGERMATVEFVKGQRPGKLGSWQVSQIKGPWNDTPPGPTLAATVQFLAKLTEKRKAKNAA
jgi:hypothetical protein